MAIFLRFKQGLHLDTACHHTLKSFDIVKIGADHAQIVCQNLKETAILLAGDALATVDPTTGLGCNTAIQSSVDFLDFIWDYDIKIPQNNLLENYANAAIERIKYIHFMSKQARLYYRPDALVPQPIAIK